MATTSKKQEEQIFVQINDERIELTGKEKEDYLVQKSIDNVQWEELKQKIQSQLALKVSAYTKLGLTEEEINAIL